MPQVNATEFYQAVNLPHVQKRFIYGGKVQTIEYSLGCRLIGTQHNIYARKNSRKHTTEYYLEPVKD